MEAPDSKQNRVTKKSRGYASELTILSVIAVAVMIIAIAGVVLYNRSQPKPVVSTSISTTPVADAQGTPLAADVGALIRSDSPTLGNADAAVTLVEFLDPECESCRAAHPAIKQIMTEYGGRVRLVVRYFPLHGNSVLAAAATEAAGQQGKYWEMQNLLFERQPEWGEKQTPQTALFIAYAEELGLDIEQFTVALEDTAIYEKVERDRLDGVALEVRGTPTFFVNGVLVQPLSLDRLIEMIEQGLE